MVLKIKISRNLFECLFRTFMHNPSTVQLKTWTKTILPPAGHCGTLGNALLPSTTRNLGTIIESVGCMFGEENLFFSLRWSHYVAWESSAEITGMCHLTQQDCPHHYYTFAVYPSILIFID